MCYNHMFTSLLSMFILIVTISAVVFNNLHLTSSSQLGGLHGNDTPTSVGSKIMSIQVEATDGSEVTFSADDPIELVLELNEVRIDGLR